MKIRDEQLKTIRALERQKPVPMPKPRPHWRSDPLAIIEDALEREFGRYGKTSVLREETRDAIRLRVRLSNSPGCEDRVLEHSISGFDMMYMQDRGQSMVGVIFARMKREIERELVKGVEKLIDRMPEPYYLVPKGTKLPDLKPQPGIIVQGDPERDYRDYQMRINPYSNPKPRIEPGFALAPYLVDADDA